jgi:hypothetical protein
MASFCLVRFRRLLALICRRIDFIVEIEQVEVGDDVLLHTCMCVHARTDSLLSRRTVGLGLYTRVVAVSPPCRCGIAPEWVVVDWLPKRSLDTHVLPAPRSDRRRVHQSVVCHL